MTRLKGIIDLVKPITKKEAYNFYKKQVKENKKEEKKKDDETNKQTKEKK